MRLWEPVGGQWLRDITPQSLATCAWYGVEQGGSLVQALLELPPPGSLAGVLDYGDLIAGNEMMK